MTMIAILRPVVMKLPPFLIQHPFVVFYYAIYAIRISTLLYPGDNKWYGASWASKVIVIRKSCMVINCLQFLITKYPFVWFWRILKPCIVTLHFVMFPQSLVRFLQCWSVEINNGGPIPVSKKLAVLGDEKRESTKVRCKTWVNSASPNANWHKESNS